MKMHCVLTEFENNYRVDVSLPGNEFSIWQKISDTSGVLYELKYKRTRNGVSFSYRPVGEYESVINPLLSISEEEYVDDFPLKHVFDDGYYNLVKTDKVFESKLLCLEKVRKELDAVHTLWFVPVL